MKKIKDKEYKVKEKAKIENAKKISLKEEKLKLLKAYENLIYYTNKLLVKYPKVERNLLIKQISDLMYATPENIIAFSKETYFSNKVKLLHNVDVKITAMKAYIRISYRNKYISNQNYTTWAEYITHISNMLGALINSLKCVKENKIAQNY